MWPRSWDGNLSCRNPMPTFAATVTFRFPDCCAETFKLPQTWQALADHRQPVLKPLPVVKSSVVSMACSRTPPVWQTRLSHWPEPLRPLPAQPVMSSFLHCTHTCIQANPCIERRSSSTLSELFHTIFSCLLFSYYPNNNTRHLICNIE